MSEAPEEEPRRRRLPVRLWVTAGLAALTLLVVVLVWFQPQKLFIDSRVSEPLPAPMRAADLPATEAASPSVGGQAESLPAPAEVARGSFVALDHATTGVVRVLDVGGERVVRLEGFETDNGPDLYLYLTAESADGDEGAFDDDFVSLGRLKGNQGDQNYDLAADVDLARYRTVVVWCDRFNSAFAPRTSWAGRPEFGGT